MTTVMIAVVVLAVLGAIFGILIFLGIGPEWLLSADTGTMALGLSRDVLFTVLIAGMFVTCIANFGMLQFVGILIGAYHAPAVPAARLRRDGRRHLRGLPPWTCSWPTRFT